MYVGGIITHPPTPCLKIARIMLECWYVSTHIYVVSENITFTTKALLIFLMSAFFENSTFTQSNNMRAMLESF